MTHAAVNLVPKDKISQDFLVARGLSIAHYAMLENSLCCLYSHLMGVTEDIAGIAFFRINNAHSRIIILEKLLKKKHGDAFNVFWNSLKTHLKDLDSTRNNVVHWATSTSMNIDLPTNQQVTSLVLIPPNFWDKSPNTPEITIGGLYDFTIKCDFFARFINTFNWEIGGGWIKKEEPVSEIYLQPITYPPQDNHPLNRQPT